MAKLQRLDEGEYNKIISGLNLTDENKLIVYRIMVNGETVNDVFNDIEEKHGKKLSKQRIYEILRRVKTQYEHQFRPWKLCPNLLLSDSVHYYFAKIQELYHENPNGYFHAGMNDAIIRLLSGQPCEVVADTKSLETEATRQFVSGYNAVIKLGNSFVLG